MKQLILLLSMIMVLMAGTVRADPETFTWTNPTQYVDGTAIPAAKQALIKTHLYWATTSNGPWIEFASVSNGTSSYSGTPPANYGIVAYYTLTVELDGALSAFLLPAVAYTRPFPACNAPTNLIIK